jgi:3-phenylpropionate/trans-cinnamate dioxygenase ferredoxin subunit
LAEGDIEGHEVTCPWHGARFDIRTGEVLCARRMTTSRATTCVLLERKSRSRCSDHQRPP